MLLKGAAAGRALSQPDVATRLYVLAGPDESASRALAAQFAIAMGADAQRIDLGPESLRSNPTCLADEAAGISLFGARSWIYVTVPQGGGDEWLKGAETVLDAAQTGNPVLVVGGGITAKSKLTRLAETSAQAIAVVSYQPNAADAADIAGALAEARGLQLSRAAARAIVASAAADRAIMAQEIEKLALFLDATPEAPQPADVPQWLSIGADMAEEDVGAIVNSVLSGDVASLPALFAELTALGTSEVRVVRAIATRALLLARLRSAVEGGDSIARAMESPAARGIFWKEKPAVQAQLRQWDITRIARLIERMHALERALKVTNNPTDLLLRDGLLAVTMQAAATR